jgi:hypothetical protein
MTEESLKDILYLLKQVWWPTKITYQTKQITLISKDMIDYHIKKLDYLISSSKNFVDEYNISDIYSLYWCIEYIITDLWIDEFETVTWKDLYSFWYRLLLDIRSYII